PDPVAAVSEDRRAGAARPADPHVCAAREVRRRPARQRPPRARRRGRPRLVWAARADRRDRTLRARPRRQVRDVRDRAHPGREPHPQTSRSSTETKEAIADAIARLPEREKLVVTLYYYEELTLREIGEVLGVTESRVSQLHTKAVLRLKARLSGYPARAGLES